MLKKTLYYILIILSILAVSPSLSGCKSYDIKQNNSGNQILRVDDSLAHFSAVLSSRYHMTYHEVDKKYNSSNYLLLSDPISGDEYGSSISIHARIHDAIADGKDKAARLMKQIQNEARPAILVDESMIMVSGIQAYEYTFTEKRVLSVSMTGPVYQIVERNVFFNYREVGYRLSMFTTEATAVSDNVSFNQLLATFKLID